MAINIRNRIDALRAGRISLGDKIATGQNGFERPVNLDYFKVEEAPGVADVYGEKPVELDVMFPSNDLDLVAPNWLMLWGTARKDARGNVTSGILRCRGDGPSEDGKPGTATHYAKKDLTTGVVPIRPCLGKECPDWKGPNGKQQCAPSLDLWVLLPRVSMTRLYQIHTGSWESISQIMTVLNHEKGMRGGNIKFLPFKLIRVEKTKQGPDGKPTTHHYLQIAENPKFMELYGSDVVEKMQNLQRSDMFTNLLSAAKEDLDEQAPPSAYILPGAQTIDAQEKVATAEEVSKDPEVAALFDKLDLITGKQSSQQGRLIAVRKLEPAEDLRAAVVATLTDKISKYTPAEISQ